MSIAALCQAVWPSIMGWQRGQVEWQGIKSEQCVLVIWASKVWLSIVDAINVAKYCSVAPNSESK